MELEKDTTFGYFESQTVALSLKRQYSIGKLFV